MFGPTGIEVARTCSVGRRESSDPLVFGNQGFGARRRGLARKGGSIDGRRRRGEVGRRRGEVCEVENEQDSADTRHMVQSVHTRIDTHDERAGDRSEIGDQLISEVNMYAILTVLLVMGTVLHQAWLRGPLASSLLAGLKKLSLQNSRRSSLGHMAREELVRT